MPGDGIGPEVTEQALLAVRAAGEVFGFSVKTTDFPHGAAYYLETRKTLSDADLDTLRDYHAILFGAVGVDPAGMKDIPQGLLETEILLRMRFAFDQFVNLRPAKMFAGVPSPLIDPAAASTDILFVRENTEGLYCGQGGFLHKGTSHEVANQIEVATRHGTERILRYAFDLARRHDRKKVTLVAKTNVLRFAHDLWDRLFRSVAAEYDNIVAEYHHVDAACMYLVTRPQAYDVVVTTNMFGDILTDLAAAVTGGLGVAASGNLNPRRNAPSMFEPVHGSAPDIAGQNKANPAAAILSAAMMLDFLGHTDAARTVESAVAHTLASPAGRTVELGGTASTIDVGRRIAEFVRRGA